MNAMTMPFDDGQQTLDGHGLASVNLGLHWSDERATHENRMHIERFSVWREADVLPRGIGDRIPGMQAGESVETGVAPGEAVDAWRSSRQVSTSPSRFDTRHRRGLVVQPRLGRFYPQGFFHGVEGIFEQAVDPARITDLGPERMVLDLNHPLARYPLTVRLEVDRVLPGYDRRGGRCAAPLDELMRYAGFVAPLAGGRLTDYGDDADGLSRMDERDDGVFYANPRLVQHLDDRALETVNGLYRRLVPGQAEILDLMASHDSHLRDCPVSRLHLLGMNAEELAANPAAENRIVRDLNQAPALPFEDGALDTIVCTASIEYLTKPAQVLAEALRVLRPGGRLVVTFSDRWFPSKAIRIWGEIHEFERVGMVTQWLQQAGFAGLHTFSSRGWPRPADDPHAGETSHSDPVFAVWGVKP